jgi:glycosyltransferase involved in cell wall biosynthesis
MFPTDAEPWFGSFVRDQVEALRRLGIVVEVLAFDGRRDVRSYAAAARSVRGLVATGRFDLVHAHYGLTGAVALAQRRVPVVTTFHGSDSGQIPWQRRVSWAVARLTSPIFVSAENAVRLGLPRAPIVPAGVDTQLFQPGDRRAARAELGWQPDGFYVLLPGARSNPVKGAELFERALDVLRRSHPEATGVSLEDRGRREVALVINAADVLLMTSLSEGSPVTVKEALACLTPVVSVPVGDVGSVVAGLPGCAVVPRVPRLLADAVMRARGIREPALRERALEFSYERVAARILEVYARVLAGTEAPRAPA